jgi:hypothetical protein
MAPSPLALITPTAARNSFFLPRMNDDSSDSLLEKGESARETPLFAKKRQNRSPYLVSSITFMLSSTVSLSLSVVSCYTDGFNAANIGALVANALYVCAYFLYVRADWLSPTTGTSGLPLMNSAPMIQHM